MIKSVLALIISSFLLLLPSSNTCHQNNDFQAFMGSWKGTGALFGTEANFSMSWKETVNGKFIELNFENQFKTANGEQKLTAKAIYWFTDDENLKGNWYDSRGVVFPLEASFKDGTLTSLWGDNDSVEKGKTVYQLTDNESISVTDYVFRNGEMSQFGEATYHRKNK